jgi:hypothetical protein
VSAVPADPIVAPKKSFWSKALKITKDVLGVALMIAGLPGGAAIIAKVPGIGGLFLKWGIRPLSNILDLLPDGVEITDDMVADALAKKGGRLEPIDMTILYGAEEPPDPPA